MSDPVRKSTPVSDAQEALARACEHLFATQDPSGYWKGELETNVTMDAEDLLLREFLGIRTDDETKHAAVWIRSQQREDGSWGTFKGGPPELSTTVEAYVALKLAGDPVDAPHMKRAAELIQSLGGLEKSRVFTRFWMALFGLWSWDDLPALPPEVIFLPPGFPLNIYDFGCWARQTIVPLTVVASHRPRRRLSFGIDELRSGARTPARRESLGTWAGRFQLLDRALHFYERHPLRPLRKAALRMSAEWILRRQEADGGWGGIQPPWVYSILALHLLGYPLTHPAIQKALRGLDGFTLDRSGRRRLEACQSPVWDTALAVVGLNDAGVAKDQPNLARAVDWLLREEIRVPGDWAVRRPKLEPGGWAFEFANDNYPDIDDTAEVILALRGASQGRADVEAAIKRGVNWTLGMQSSNDGWAAFDVDNTSSLCAELPFCDFGEVTDPPSADVTAHVIEMLAVEGLANQDATRRGREWLLREQEADGSWFGRWGANYVYGTGAAVPALVACGTAVTDASIRRAVTWLESVQNADGGWGEDLRSYVDRSFAGRGTSTASQTAWALLALLAAGERGSAVERGVHFLVSTQRADGDWDEPEFTGTGFPGDFYIRYHMYRIVFPLMALGRYVRGGK